VSSLPQEQLRKQQTKQEEGTVNRLASRYVVPAALVLDIITMLIRIAETTIQLTLPEAYAAWSHHDGQILTVLYYAAGIIVVIGLSLGVSASLFVSMPLLYEIERRIDAAQRNKNRRVRRDQVAALTRKKGRYARYIGLACTVPVLFGASYFLSQQGIAWLKYLTAIADVAAPIIVLFVITQTEREHSDIDPQERAVSKASDVLIENLNRITPDGGLLRKEQAAMLKAGTEGDLEGMIDAATPQDETDRYYTIVDICRRLGFPTARDSAPRKKIYRIVALAYRQRQQGVIRSSKGRGYLVPGKAFDALFGDLMGNAQFITQAPPTPSEPPQGQVQAEDRQRTVDASTEAPGAGTGGQAVDVPAMSSVV
jgi:hypothetical protein